MPRASRRLVAAGKEMMYPPEAQTPKRTIAGKQHSLLRNSPVNRTQQRNNAYSLMSSREPKDINQFVQSRNDINLDGAAAKPYSIF